MWAGEAVNYSTGLGNNELIDQCAKIFALAGLGTIHSLYIIRLTNDFDQMNIYEYFLGENDNILTIISKNRQHNWTKMKGHHIKIYAEKPLKKPLFLKEGTPV